MKLFADRAMGPAARSAFLANTARARLAELTDTGRASRQFRKFVDGVEGASEDAVQPSGVILYEFVYVARAAVFALEFLRGRAPVGTGRFRDSFVVAVNGRPIPAASFVPASVPSDAQVIVYNSQPYSRKVDVQLVGTKRLRFTVPAGLFDDAARALGRQFGNTLDVRRVYNVSVPDPWTTRSGRKTEYPALVIQRRV